MDIEQYIQSLIKKRAEIQQEVLPNLANIASEFLMDSWIPVWRNSPYWNGQYSSPIPKDFGVSAFYVHCENGSIEFQLDVTWPPCQPAYIPKKLMKQARFANRCKKDAKRKVLVEEVDKLLIKELKLPDGKFLRPYWDVEKQTVYVNRTLGGFKIPYPLKLNDANKLHQDWKNRKAEVEKKIQEFRDVIPPAVQDMVGSILGIPSFRLPPGYSWLINGF